MVTLQNELRSIVSKRAPAYFDVQQMIARDNGEEFGSPLKWILWNSATVPTNQIKNTNSDANTPARWSKDDNDALIWEERKSGVNAGKLLTGQAGGVFYPTLISKASASGTVNLDASSAGVITRPLWKNWNGTTVYAQSDSTEMVINPQARVTNGSVDYLKANSTEVLTLTQLRNWNGTTDWLKSTATELVVNPQARVTNGTIDYLKANSTEVLTRAVLRNWDGTSDWLKSTSTELLVRPKFRLWDGTNDLINADTSTGVVNIGGAGTARRITADFTNATVLNRLLFQTSTANSPTALGAIPSGSGTQSNMNFYNGTDPTASSVLQVGMLAAEARVLTLGTGVTTLPLRLYSGATRSLEIDNGKLGFYTTTAIAKPTVTGSRGGNAALASALTQLAALGLLTDSSTA